MSDLISRSALYKDIEGRPYINKALAEIFETIIDEQTEVEAVPVVHAKWIRKTDGRSWTHYTYECSNCKGGENYDSKYCPRCGAIMDGE